MAKTAVSPTFTGPLPHLEVDLTNCELGEPLQAAWAFVELVRRFTQQRGTTRKP